MAYEIPRIEETAVEIAKREIIATIPDLDTREPLERVMILQCIDDCSYWKVITDTLKRDVLEKGVLANKTKGGKDNRQRVQVERETMALLHKVQPRMYEAFKRLESLCNKAGNGEKHSKDPFIDFISN